MGCSVEAAGYFADCHCWDMYSGDGNDNGDNGDDDSL